MIPEKTKGVFKMASYAVAFAAILGLLVNYLWPATVAVAQSEWPTVGRSTFAQYQEETLESLGQFQMQQQQQFDYYGAQLDQVAASNCVLFQNLSSRARVYVQQNPDDVYAVGEMQQLDSLRDFWCSQL